MLLYSQEAALDTQAEATHAAAEPRWKLPSAPAPVGVWGRSPDLGVGWKCVSDASAVTEVHLRRVDESDQLHRRVVAVLTVDATPEEVCQECFMTASFVSSLISSKHQQKQYVATNSSLVQHVSSACCIALLPHSNIGQCRQKTSILISTDCQGHNACFAAISHSATAYSSVGVGGADRL